VGIILWAQLANNNHNIALGGFYLRLPFFSKRKQEQKKEEFSPSDLAQRQVEQKTKLRSSAKDNAEALQELMGKDNADFTTRELTIPTTPSVEAQLCFCETMIDATALNKQILEPLLLSVREIALRELPGKSVAEKIGRNLLLAGKLQNFQFKDEVLSAALGGQVVLFLEGSEIAMGVELRKIPERAIVEPQSETVLRGPREGFTECLSDNKSLLRVRIKSGKLRFDSFRIGRISENEGAVIYLEGIANPKLIREIKRRIKSLDVDMVADSSVLEKLIEDHPLLVFPTTLFTERPDLVEFALTEGRVGVMLENSPACLIAPANFFDFFKTAEDNYIRWPYTSFIRSIRLLAGLVSIWAPATYIAITTFHREMLPTALALSIAGARENVPFPAFIEAFSMELILELVLEAGVRLPSPIGQSIGIVGAVVLGQAAVSAQIVSPFLVIVVAITSLSSFVVPLFVAERGVRLLRFPLMILGATMGLYGIMAGMAAIAAVQTAMTSFGQPYFAPLAPFWPRTLTDIIFNPPIWMANKRPKWLRPGNRRRQDFVVRDWAQDGENPDGEVDLSGE